MTRAAGRWTTALWRHSVHKNLLRKLLTSSTPATVTKFPCCLFRTLSGFMVGADAEHSGIIRAGARFVEAMATAAVPKIVLTLNTHPGAGYYAMAGQGLIRTHLYSWPTGRMA